MTNQYSKSDIEIARLLNEQADLLDGCLIKYEPKDYSLNEDKILALNLDKPLEVLTILKIDHPGCIGTELQNNIDECIEVLQLWKYQRECFSQYVKEQKLIALNKEQPFESIQIPNDDLIYGYGEKVLDIWKKFPKIIKQFRIIANHLQKINDKVEASSNISGMPWQTVKKEAEEYVKKYGFPGVEPLAKKIGCSDGTLKKAIDDSEILQKAKSQKKKKTSPKTESIFKEDPDTKNSILNEDIIKENKELPPDLQADINLLSKNKTTEDLINGIIKYTQIIEKDEHKRDSSFQCQSEQELKSQFNNCTKEQLAALYLTRQTEANDIHADDPKKPAHRRKL